MAMAMEIRNGTKIPEANFRTVRTMNIVARRMKS
jgi:hypothetical protein